MILKVILAIVCFAITIAAFVGVARGQGSKRVQDTLRKHAGGADMSIELRNKALSTTAAYLGLKPPTDDDVYGVVMDWGLGDKGTNTLVCYITGDASMYFSRGGGMIGGGKHEPVRMAAIKYVRYAQSFLPKTTLTQAAPPDTGNSVRFYLLTNSGLHTASAGMQAIENETWEMRTLFYAAQNVITEYRKVMNDLKH